MTGNETRHHIIQTGAELIARQGFSATGINKILDAAQVPKGSFYHYFRSKDDFGLAVIEAYAAEYDQRLDDTLGNTALAPLERLQSYLSLAGDEMASCDYTKGCLIGNLGQELAAQNEAFRSRLDQVFTGWEKRFQTCIVAAQANGEVSTGIDAAEAASLLLSGWQGALLRAKLSRSEAPLQRFRNLLFDTLLTR
ncbi:MAG: TetR family transcriptional regulator [Halomonadaceae bacterium]|nr:MAG: TetR family transcriptional regulator [Halomonadaceae bacterium]